MAAGDPGSPARYYSSTAVETSLQSSIGAQSQGQSNTSFIVASVSGFPSSLPYTLIVDPDTSKEEVVTVTAASSTTLTVTRGADNTQAVAHSAGAVVRHGVSGRDFRESQVHIAARGYDTDSSILATANQTHVHGLATGDGDVVGTTKTQTLTNKTLASPTITGSAGLATSIVFEGSTSDEYETTLTVTDPTADRTITLPNATGQVVLRDTTDTLTNKTLTSPTISGSPVITGLSSAGMISSSATPKDYVDSILGSATAAATSAASAAASATAAATSATSAASSATAAATSATSASNSASAAATSATSASNSASAASTSATSAAASETAAATSASSASTSASSALTSANSASTSASSALTSANSASTSASAAATSATSASNSASAAATSATSASNSASAAATSATSASNSASAAATSASSASTSASSALTSANSASTSASSAATSESNAATSASSASTSASSALTSANSASTSASSALTSATSAATSATSAASSATSAEAAWDQFDDRYLGAKSSDPTLDNDGNALVAGALYFNTVLPAMKVYTGSAWQLVAPDTSNFVDKALWTAKGTLISATTASTPTALTVASTNGYVLTVSSSAATGLAWAEVDLQSVEIKTLMGVLL